MPGQLPALLPLKREMKASASCPELSSPVNRLFLPKRCWGNDPKQAEDLLESRQEVWTQKSKVLLAWEMKWLQRGVKLINLFTFVTARWNSRRHGTGLPGAVRVSRPQGHRQLGEVTETETVAHSVRAALRRVRTDVRPELLYVSPHRSWSSHAQTYSQ